MGSLAEGVQAPAVSRIDATTPAAVFAQRRFMRAPKVQ
jgi:hypothetical protein